VRNRGAKHAIFVIWGVTIMIEESHPHGKTRQVIKRYTILAILLFKKESLQLLTRSFSKGGK